MSGKDNNEFDWLYDPEERSRPSGEEPDTLEYGRPESDESSTAHRHIFLKVLAVLAGAAVLSYGAKTGYDNLSSDSHVAVPNQSPSILPPSPGSSAGNTVQAIASPKTSPTSRPPSNHSRTRAECIADLPLSFKLGQKIMISATAATLPQAAEVASKYDVGGIILMDQAPASAVESMQQKQALPMLVATDQEGGSVQRYKSEGLLPAAADVPSTNLNALSDQIAADDRYLKSQGINMNLAPVVDVAPASGNSVLGSRIFSSDPAVVYRDALVYVQVGLYSGVLPTLKHFPGLGSATQNTDYGPATTPSFDLLKQRDLLPYENFSGSKVAVMVGNQTVPGLTGGIPASLSRSAITTELRGNLGYKNNVVITDSLSAKAVTSLYSINQAAVRSWEAGSDIALVVGTTPGETLEWQVSHIIALGKQAVQSGGLSQSEVNASTGRLMALPQKQANACKLDANLAAR